MERTSSTQLDTTTTSGGVAADGGRVEEVLRGFSQAVRVQEALKELLNSSSR
jgi:hypothetical protein